MSTTIRNRLDKVKAITLIERGDMSYQDIGNILGVCRERVRQIAKQNGFEPKRKQIKSRDAEIVATLTENKLSDAVLAARFGVKPSVVARIRKKANIGSFREETAPSLLPAMKAVEEGSSIRAAAKSFGVSVERLRRHCARSGVGTTFGRWGALTHRYALIAKGRADGRSWDDIRTELSAIEKRTVTINSIVIWTKKNLPEFA